MEKTYFLYENGQVSQPYTLDDLRQKNLTGDTMICEKFGAWKTVREIPELQELWEWAPPAPPSAALPHPEMQELPMPDDTSTNANGTAEAHRPLVPASFGLAVLCFFFVFCDLKCGEQKLASVTGFQFVTGTSITGPGMEGFSENDKHKIPPNIWANIAFISGLMGLGLYIFSKKEGSGPGIAFGAIGAVSMLALQTQVKNGFEKQGEGALIAEFQIAYWLSLIAMIAAAVISYTLQSRPEEVQVSPMQAPPPPVPPPQKEEFPLEEMETKSVSVEPEPFVEAIEEEVPKRRKGKGTMFASGFLGIIVLAVSGYFFLIKPGLDSKSSITGDALLSEEAVPPAGRKSPAGKAIEKIGDQSDDVKKQIINKLIAMGVITEAEVKACGGAGKVIDSLQNIDLNEDGEPEFIAYFFCIDIESVLLGFSVFRKIADEVEEIFDCRGCERSDISPSKTYTNGWRDLELSYYSARTGESYSEILRWNGRCYQNALTPCPR